MASTSPAPARVETIDAVRGVAVMGILLMNIVAFSMHDSAYMNPRAYGGAEGANLAVYLINFILFDGKMRGLFSFLFGASMLLVIERAEARGESPARVHYARMIWLLLFGLAHLWLVWWGDILSLYAPVGMIAFLFRKKPTHRLVAIGIVLVLAECVLLGFLPFGYHMMELATAQPGGGGAQTARRLAEMREQFGGPTAAQLAADLAIHRGGYVELLRYRFAEHVGAPLQMFVFVGAETLGYMLFGMAALKSGLLAGAWTGEAYRRWALIGLGIGIAAYGALAIYVVSNGFSASAVILSVLALPTPVRPIMVTGWACLIVLLARSGGPIAQLFAAAGRMAFTNYLATSLICTTIFYGYGLGWYGYLERWQLYLVVAGVWAGMLVWSKLWLAHFRFGPFEWVWRSLARWQPQPMRGAALTANASQ